MNIVVRYIIVVALAYLVGSFPSGYVFARLWGQDIRRTGSGRTGGTNVMRTLGTVPALLTIIADTTKGLAAVGMAGLLLGSPAAQALAGLAVIIGHN